MRDTLVGAGLTEIVTSALVSPRHLETFVLRREVPSVGGEPQPGGVPITVTNPLSRDHSLLRRNLIGSILDVVGVNLRHGTDDVAVFEIGKGYARQGDAACEWWRAGFALVGAAEAPAWNRSRRPYDLDDAKGVVELLARRLHLSRPTWTPEPDEPLFHPGRTARVTAGDRLQGIVGEFRPALVRAWELRTTDRVLVGELSLEGLAEGTLRPERAPTVSRFPDTERDLAIVVPETIPAAAVEATVTAAAGPLLRAISLFDIYRGVPLGVDEKSLAFRLAFAAPDRTLTEDEVEGVVAGIVMGLGAIGGRLRA